MADHIAIRPAEGTWVVRAGGAVIGESDNALKVTEDGKPFIVYFPRGDIAMEFLDRSDTVRGNDHMGDARHYSIATRSTLLRDVAWSYEDPKPAAAQVKGFVAFDASDQVAIEQV